MNAKYFDLENKRVLVTGGGSGIGASIVEHFCEQGSEVYFVDINVEDSNNLVTEIKNKNYKTPTFIKCDLLNIKKFQNVLENIISEKGPINILVNNAANDERHTIDEVTVDLWNERININLRHFFFAVQSVKSAMIKEKKGRIINLTSTVGVTGNRGQANYSASKSGLEAFSKSLAKEVGSRGITVNSVSPGYIETDMTKGISDEVKKQALGQIPLGRFGSTKEISYLIKFLISDESLYITGQTIHINGGLYM